MSTRLAEIFDQASSRLAAHRTQGTSHGASHGDKSHANACDQPPPRSGLVPLIFRQAALKLAYTGHCGRPGHRGGSRPKSACGVMPVSPSRLRAVGRDQLARQSSSPNQYTVERSIAKGKGRGEERITRVIYEKRRNPEEREQWLKDIGVDFAKSLAGAAAAGGVAYGVWKVTKGRAGVGMGVPMPGGARLNVDMAAPKPPRTTSGDIDPDDVLDALDNPPKSTRAAKKTAKGKKPPTVGQKTGPAVAPTKNATPKKATRQRPTPVTPPTPAAGSTPGTSPVTQPPRKDVADALSPAIKGPRTSPKQAIDDLDTYLTGLRQKRQGVWTQEGNLKKPKGSPWYHATIVNKKGVRRQMVRIWNGQAFEWKRA